MKKILFILSIILIIFFAVCLGNYMQAAHKSSEISNKRMIRQAMPVYLAEPTAVETPVVPIQEMTFSENEFVLEGILVPIERPVGKLWGEGEYNCAIQSREKTTSFNCYDTKSLPFGKKVRAAIHINKAQPIPDDYTGQIPVGATEFPESKSLIKLEVIN